MSKLAAYYLIGREAASEIEINDVLSDEDLHDLAQRVLSGTSLHEVAAGASDRFLDERDFEEKPWTREHRRAIKDDGVDAHEAWTEFRRGLLEGVHLSVAEEIDDAFDRVGGDEDEDDDDEEEDDDDGDEEELGGEA